MSYENNNNEKQNDSVFSKRLKAGKRRTYFFDVRSTRSNDYYITITESKKKFNENGYERHKIFLYKEDFNKFLKSMTETIDHVKTELMPEFDFDAFNHDDDYNEGEGYKPYTPPSTTSSTETSETITENETTTTDSIAPDTTTDSETVSGDADKW